MDNQGLFNTNSNTSANSMITPSYYEAQTQPVDNGKKKRIIFVVVAIAIVAIIFMAIIILKASHQSSDDSALVAQRENTPTLQLYSKLKEETTLWELRQLILEIEPSAMVSVEDGGYGTIRIPDAKDAIFFNIDRIDDSYDESGAIDTINNQTGASGNENDSVNIIDTYATNDPVSFFRYVHELHEESDMGISFDDEENTYYVYIDDEGFSFPTKQQAIDAYLSPEVNQ